jgi:hypothetical protein
MSALGQKRTCAVQKGMSALRPIATAKATTSRHWAANSRPHYIRLTLFENRSLTMVIYAQACTVKFSGAATDQLTAGPNKKF